MASVFAFATSTPPHSLTMSSTSSFSSDMEHYLGSQLFDAHQREEALASNLLATQKELQEHESRAAEYKFKYQRLDDLLEAEQAATNAERLAREGAEETIAQHRAQLLKLRRDEANANKHCEVAEAEIVSLREELSKERSKIAAWCELFSRLNEDVRRAESSESTAYDLLEASKTKARSLQEELIQTSERTKEVESRARNLEKRVREEHRRATEAETCLEDLMSEMKSKDLNFNNLLEKYNILSADHSKCNTKRLAAASNPTTDDMVIRKHYPPSPKSGRGTISPAHKQNAIINLTKLTANEKTIKPPPTKPKDQAINPARMPTPPKPAILRPSLASTQVETFTPAAGRVFPVSNANVETNKLRWKFLCRLPAEALELLCGCPRRR